MERNTDSSLQPGVLSHSDKLVGHAERNLAQEALYSATYSSLQAPLSALTQTIDKVLNTNLQSSTRFMDAPAEAEFFSARWHSQQIGGAAGMVAPFLLLHKGVGMAGARLFGQVEANGLAANALTRRTVIEGAVTGGLYEVLCRPVSPKDGDFLTAKARNAAVGALTFGTLAAGVGGIKDLVKAERGIAGRVLRSEIGSSMLASVPAGILNAEASSLLAGKGLAPLQDVKETTYAFVFAGGALSVGKTAFGGTKAEAALNKHHASESARSIAEGAPTLSERLSARIESTGTKVATLLDSMSPPRLEPALAGVTAAEGARFVPDNVLHMSLPAKQLRGGLNGNRGGFIPPDLAETIKVRQGEAATPEAKPAVEPVREPQSNDRPPRAKEVEPTEKEHPADKPALEQPKPKPKPAEVFPDGTFYFMDCNSPGWVYRGTEAHMRGLAREGGFPDRCKISRPIVDEKMRFELADGTVEWWDVEHLRKDHFWSLPDEQYYYRENGGERPAAMEDYAVVRERELKAASEGTVLEKPVPQEVWRSAMSWKLHPHGDSVVVFLDGQNVIYFDGVNGRQAVFSLRECARANLMKSRLGGHDVTGAVVFTPNPFRALDGTSHKPFKPSRFFGVKPGEIGRVTLDQFLEDRGQLR